VKSKEYKIIGTAFVTFNTDTPFKELVKQFKDYKANPQSKIS